MMIVTRPLRYEVLNKAGKVAALMPDFNDAAKFAERINGKVKARFLKVIK